MSTLHFLFFIYSFSVVFAKIALQVVGRGEAAIEEKIHKSLENLTGLEKRMTEHYTCKSTGQYQFFLSSSFGNFE